MKQHRVYHELRRAIYTGQIKPGEKLVERQLAETFETSRGPLRESLLRLTSEGLLRQHPRRTCHVKELTLADLRDIYLMRYALEPLAARLAAARPARPFVRKLDKLIRQMATNMQRCRYIDSAEADFEFHREIVLASESPRLIRAYDLAHVPMLMSQLSPQFNKPDVLAAIHQDLADAIRAGEPDRAEELSRHHISGALENNSSGGLEHAPLNKRRRART